MIYLIIMVWHESTLFILFYEGVYAFQMLVLYSRNKERSLDGCQDRINVIQCFIADCKDNIDSENMSNTPMSSQSAAVFSMIKNEQYFKYFYVVKLFSPLSRMFHKYDI